MPALKFLFLVFFCFFLTSCVTTQTDVDQLRHQVRILERQQQQYRQDMAVQLEDYQARLEAMDQVLSASGGSVQQVQANLWAEIQSLKVQVATLTGRLDALDRQHLADREGRREADQALKELRTRAERLDRSVQMMASQLGVEIAEAERAEKDDPAPAGETPHISADADSAQVLYQRALDSFYERNYQLAQALWEEFADNFPDHALTANAYFWQGESFYQMQNYAQAVLAYQEVITRFPDSNKLSASLLKQGMSFYLLGRQEAGKLVLTELLEKFPDTAEARRARAVMAEHQ